MYKDHKVRKFSGREIEKCPTSFFEYTEDNQVQVIFYRVVWFIGAGLAGVLLYLLFLLG